MRQLCNSHINLITVIYVENSTTSPRSKSVLMFLENKSQSSFRTNDLLPSKHVQKQSLELENLGWGFFFSPRKSTVWPNCLLDHSKWRQKLSFTRGAMQQQQLKHFSTSIKPLKSFQRGKIVPTSYLCRLNILLP